MSRRDDPPCEHWDDQVGTVSAGDLDDKKSPFVGVATCKACLVKSQGYVQFRTGLPANPFQPYPEES